MILDSDNCLLLLVDIQEKLLEKIYDNISLIDNTRKVFFFFNKLRLPVIISEQYPQGLGKTSDEILNNDLFQKKDTFFYSLFEKTSFSCFADYAIKSRIKKSKKKQVVICGVETHICILQTVSDLLTDDFSVFLVSDAMGSRTKKSHELGLQRMSKIGANIVNTEMILFELLRDSKHKDFKELSKLIR